MTEPVSVFIDQFQLNTSPYGATLNFMLTDPVPPSPGTERTAGHRAHEPGAPEGDVLYHFTLVKIIRSPDRHHDPDPEPDVELDGHQSGRLGRLLAQGILA
jgi:hypothetical protein